jgi:ribose 5-phosphate isomerase B
MIFMDHLQTLLIASDHAGLELKTALLRALPTLPWQDLGTHSTESVDYPDYADKVCALVRAPTHVGVLICGSGQGMAIRANRHRDIRAALCWHEEIARLSRAHNDANVLCLGARTMDFKACERILTTFLTTSFEGGRHTPRVEKLGWQ